jgi:hypothetical protein
MDLSIGSHIEQLWNCHMTALCIFRINGESSEMIKELESVYEKVRVLDS